MSQWFAVIVSAFFLLFTIELLRRERLLFKYAIGWIIGCIIAVFLALFDGFLFKISDLFGFELPSNFVFFALISVLILMSLLISVFLSQQNIRNDKMAQQIALLSHEVDQLKKHQGKGRHDSD